MPEKNGKKKFICIPKRSYRHNWSDKNNAAFNAAREGLSFEGYDMLAHGLIGALSNWVSPGVWQQCLDIIRPNLLASYPAKSEKTA